MHPSRDGEQTCGVLRIIWCLTFLKFGRMIELALEGLEGHRSLQDLGKTTLILVPQANVLLSLGTVWPWESYFTLLSLNFLICKMRIRIVFVSWHRHEDLGNKPRAPCMVSSAQCLIHIIIISELHNYYIWLLNIIVVLSIRYYNC